MTLPQIIVDLLTLLFDLAVPAAICTMVLAGIALRQEGGVNFQIGGKFQRWMLWSVILLTLLKGNDAYTLLGMTWADSDLIQVQENVISKAVNSLTFVTP